MKKTSYVYAISDGTAIKIGVSNNPHKRIKALSTGNKNKLYLLGYFEGGFELEKIIHNNFQKIRDNGEWLYASPELIEYLNNLILDRFIIVYEGIIKTHPKISM